MIRRSLLTVAAGAAPLASLSCASLPAVGPTSPGRWERRAGLETPRDDFGAAVASGRIYVVGGMSGERGNDLDTLEIYDPSANAWSRGPRLPTPVSSLRAAVLGNALVAAGGSVRSAEVPHTWRLPLGTRDLREAAWEPAPPLRTPRLGHGLAVLSQRLIAAGGLVHGEPTADVELYDPERGTWVPAAPLPAPRFNLSLTSLGSSVYALGGSGPDRRPSSSVFVYNPTVDRWTAGPSLPQPLSNFGAAVLDNHLHALLHKHHFALAPDGATWLLHPPMPTSRHGQAVAALGGALYAIAGCSEEPQRDLPVTEAYRVT